MLEFDFDRLAPETTGTQNMPPVSTVASDVEELQKRNKELEMFNTQLLGMVRGVRDELKGMKEGLETAKEELQSVRTHNARLQGELSSLTKRRRVNNRTKHSDLERSQAAEITGLKKELAQAKLREFSVPGSDTSNGSSAEDVPVFFRDSSASSNSRQGSVESSRKRRSPGVEIWDNSLDLLQFNTGPSHQQNVLFSQALHGNQNQQSVSMASMAQFGGLPEEQSMSGYPQLYNQDQMAGQHNQLSWGTGYTMNSQPQQGNGMSSCQNYPGPYQASNWSF
ncbi:hypothetical protein GL218_06422 [Daldinia childiae]|uniref:uncharacterized protein n=1 Tax=Daldinia childiae TaxID=326645 RepID=UPI001447967E|nr:uncharacterized protein GL218_06422 [Daldinia childiae]KAF3056249.1 hypothetical protein GL218_06422 [Daldinia childiae]